MPPEVAFGLAASARHAMTPTEAEFDFVRLLGLDAAAAQDAWDVEPLGQRPAAGGGDRRRQGGTSAVGRRV